MYINNIIFSFINIITDYNKQLLYIVHNNILAHGIKTYNIYIK